jgi:hypothetical protein
MMQIALMGQFENVSPVTQIPTAIILFIINQLFHFYIVLL